MMGINIHELRRCFVNLLDNDRVERKLEIAVCYSDGDET